MLIDDRKHPVCETCGHPFHSEVPTPNTGKDENGEYIVCSKCGNKTYINKPKEL